MKPYILIFLLLVLGLNSCKKKEELPEPVEEKPALYLEGTINSIPFRLETGINATYGSTAAYKYINTSTKDTFQAFYYTLNIQDKKKNLVASLEIGVNNYKDRPSGVFETDLNNTIKKGDYNYDYFSSMFPGDINVSVKYTDYVSGDEYYSPLYFQGSQNKFKILSVKDEYRDGKHYKVVEVMFNAVLPCMYSSPQYYIPLSAKGVIAFGPA